jgi:hypothetical protein
MVSMYCSNSTFLLLFMSVSSSPNFLNASFNRLGASFYIHSVTVLYLTASGLFVDSREASLKIEKDSFWELMLPFLEMFSCLIRPSSYFTLGLHYIVRDSLLLNRSETVEVTSSLRISNSIQNHFNNYYAEIIKINSAHISITLHKEDLQINPTVRRLPKWNCKTTTQKISQFLWISVAIDWRMIKWLNILKIMGLLVLVWWFLLAGLNNSPKCKINLSSSW